MSFVSKRKVLLVDDQKLFVDGLSIMLQANVKIEIIGIIDNGDDVFDFVNLNQPEVILLDLNLPGKNGLEVLKEIRETNEEVIISILSMYADVNLAKKCRELGANAYLTKDAGIEELHKVVFDLAPNDFYQSEQINAQKQVISIKQDKFNKFALITAREREIIVMLVKGLTSQQISERLFISQATVQTHRKNIFNKLNVNKVSELIRHAYENNIT
jgi:DNA-binding NarL/FixJ family response regulator